MGGRWNPNGFQFLNFLVLIFGFLIQGFHSLNSEGLALLEFWARIDSDPYGAFADWNPNDSNPCTWSGVRCVDGKVQMLDLNARSLVGTLAPALAKLSELRSLVLSNNQLFGVVPKEFGRLKKLELLDLRSNYLSGTIPTEITNMLSLKLLLLSNNKFEGSSGVTLGKLNMFCNLKSDQNLTLLKAVRIRCINRKLGHCIWQSNDAESWLISVRGALIRYLNTFPILLFNVSKDLGPEDQQCCSSNMHGYHTKRNLLQLPHRRLIEQPKNLEVTAPGDAAPIEQIIAVPLPRSSGTYPAVPDAKKTEPPPLVMLPMPPEPSVESPDSGSPKSFWPNASSEGTSASQNLWKYLIIIPIVAIVLAAIILLIICRKRAAKTIGPWKTGISGQLQKAFVTGVPKLNRPELETACEDFSNIIQTPLDGCVIYKGTLSSGVEIAVASAVGKTAESYSKSSERAFRKRIDTLSRVNHKNFVNLIGYCEEKEPFTRMLVFEYAPNGALSEHLHVEEMEHLDWVSRMRIIMGVAYCLQYMHHDLNPPVSVMRLVSTSIFLTDDYAAKIGEVNFITKIENKSKISSEDDGEHSELLSEVDPESNVYSFGTLLIEIISAKHSRSEKEPIENWAAQYLKDKRDFDKLVDSSLKSFKQKELDILCEVILECIEPDSRKRPTMKEVTAKLREVISISPEQAAPRLSPLWWAELEILSQEAA